MKATKLDKLKHACLNYDMYEGRCYSDGRMCPYADKCCNTSTKEFLATLVAIVAVLAIPFFVVAGVIVFLLSLI